MNDETEQKSPEAALLPVFHGTRLSSAEAIMARGFNPTSVAELVAEVAKEHGIPVEDVNAHMKRRNRFAVLDHRPGAVYVCADPEKAGSWASRAPEATWEALWTIWALKHPELGDEYYQSIEGHFWVLAQQLADPPAFVAMLSPSTALFQHPHGGDAAEWFAKLIGMGYERSDVVELFIKTPEWRVDPTRVHLAGFKELPTRAPTDVAAFMAQRDKFEFLREAHEGERWGEPAGSEVNGAWFPFHHIWRLLRPERREELQEFAGVSIGEKL